MRLHTLTRRLVLFLILGSVLLAGSCKKQPFINTVEQTPYLGFPGGLDQLYQIDITDLREREDFAQLKASFDSSPQGMFFKGLQEQTGFDLFQQCDSILLATKGPADPKNPVKNMLIIAKGNFANAEDVIGKLPEYLSQDTLIGKPAFRKGEQAGFPRYQATGQSQYNESIVYDINIGLPAKDLLVLAFDAQQLNSALDVIGGQAQGIQFDKSWLELLKRVNTGTSLWGVGKMDPATTQQFASLSPMLEPLGKARQFYYTVTASGDLQVEAGLICETIDDATKLSDALKAAVDKMKPMLAMLAGKAPTLGQIPSKLFITTEQQTSKITFSLSAQEMRQIEAEIQALQPKPGAGAAAPAK